MSHKTRRRKQLDDEIAKAAEKEGLTVNVLDVLAKSFKKQEDKLLEHAFLQLATIFGNPALAAGEEGNVADLAAASLGGSEKDPPSRKEQKQLRTLSGQHQKICSKLEENRLEVESIRTAAVLQDRLTEFDNLRSSGNNVAAAQCIVSVAETLKGQAQSPASTEEQLLRSDFAARDNGLAQDLARQVDSAIICSSNAETSTVQVSIQNPEKLSEAWQALQILQEEQKALQTLASKVENALFHDQCLPCEIVTKGDSTLKTLQAVLRSGSLGDKNKVHEAVKSTLDFIGDYGLSNAARLCNLLGQALWPGIARIYIELCLSPLRSQDADGVAFEQACLDAERLEDEIEELGFLQKPDDVTRALPLHAFTRQALDVRLTRLKTDVVAKARQLMLQPFHETVTVGARTSGNSAAMTLSKGNEGEDCGTEQPRVNGQAAEVLANGFGLSHSDSANEEQKKPFLATGSYQVSRTTVEILELVQHGLLQAAKSRSRVSAQALLAALSEIAGLYAAVIPAIWSRELQVPMMAALFHNNCCHLAQEFVLQPLYYCSWADLQVADAATLDCLTSLRAAGREALKSIADSQKAELQDILASAQNFQRISEAKRGIQARKAVSQVLQALRRLGAVLKPVLPAAAFVGFGADIIASPCQTARASIMRSTDISADERKDLPLVLEPLAVESASVFVSSSKGPSNDPVDSQALAQAVEECCKPLQQLQATLQVVESSLGSVRSMWEEGVLKSKGLTAHDVVHLISALHVETDLRDAVIADIES